MPKPLAALRILDLGRVFSAPWATQLLGDLGAEVIKIEQPGEGDSFRGAGGPYLEDGAGHRESHLFLSCNRAKQSVTVNLATPEGQDIIRRLAMQCDVFIENYKVGDLARYGLDYAGISAANPEIVYVSLTGFGQTGPDRKRFGFDTLFQGGSGVMSITGEPDGPPQKVGFVIADFVSGMYAVVGALAALRHRDAGGGGQYVDVAMLDSMFAALSHAVQSYLLTGENPPRFGNGAAARNAPIGLYKCADGDLMVSAPRDQLYVNLCKALGHPEWIGDARFLDRDRRYEHRAELDALIGGVLATDTVRAWHQRLTAADVIATPVNSVAQAAQDPQIKARGMVVEVPHPFDAHLKMVGNPLKFSNTPIDSYVAPPLLGADTDGVLHRLLGMQPDEIARLRARGAI